MDYGAELVEHQRPRRAGTACGRVKVSQRQHRDRRGLVWHVVGIGAPHHDRALLHRLNQPNSYGVAVGRLTRG
jgi:hypothetical protein